MSSWSSWTAEKLVSEMVDNNRTLEATPIVFASMIFWFVALYISSRTSPIWAPKAYAALGKNKQIHWDVRVVSTLFSIIVAIAGGILMTHPVVEANPLYAYTPETHALIAVCAGYFLYDSVLCLLYFDEYGWGFLAHAVSCFLAYYGGLLPFPTYYGCGFLLFEVSTVFLNTNWILQKTGHAGTLIYNINALLLLLSYVGIRLCFGLYYSFHFFRACYFDFDNVPKVMFIYYSLANLLLNSLNIFWFATMVPLFATRILAGKNQPKSPKASKKGD